MITGLLLILIPFAGLGGWYLARRDYQLRSSQQATNSPPIEYLVGLNYLLNEQPDKAVDIFIKILEVNSETVEMHLALGNLFRRRGEVDRAIRIHQNLIARPHLSKQHRTQSLLALAQDYMRAGMIDRAERLFQEVLEAGEQQTVSLHYLLEIYQQQKNWEQAIATAQKYEAASGESMHVKIGHYYCEIAQLAIDQGQFDAARRYLKRALAVDRQCVRASLAQADLDRREHKYKSAIKAYKQIKEQDPDYLSEIIEPLVYCYANIHAETELYQYLEESLQSHPRVAMILALADNIYNNRGSQAAAEFIANQLRRYPSIRGLKRLIELLLQNADGSAQQNLTILQSLTAELLESKPIYRCTHCGFKGKTLHWQCPGCKGWSTVKPIHGIEGD